MRYSRHASGLLLPDREIRPPGICDILCVNNLAGLGAGSRGDPYWNSVVAALHLDGTDAATTITDSKGAHVWTARGNAQIDTAQSKFGGASLLLDGTGDWIDTPDHADFNTLLNTDFTIDFWLRINSLAASGNIFSQFEDDGAPAQYFNAYVNTSGYLALTQAPGSGVGADKVFNSGAAMTTNTWYWYRLVRASDVLYAWLDGATTGSVSYTGTYSTLSSVAAIGADTFSGASYFNGWLDDYRITKGVARSSGTGAITVPTAAFFDF